MSFKVELFKFFMYLKSKINPTIAVIDPLIFKDITNGKRVKKSFYNLGIQNIFQAQVVSMELMKMLKFQV